MNRVSLLFLIAVPASAFIAGPAPFLGGQKLGMQELSSRVLASCKFSPAAARFENLRMTATPTAKPDLDMDRATLLRAARNRDVDGNAVVQALERLERASRASKDEEVNSAMLAKLTGSWRLIFTTGDKTTQGVIGGRINYFPVRAVQTFDCNSGFISNGVFLGPLSMVFSGKLNLVPKMRRLEFYFDRLALGPLALPISAGQDGKIKPFFSWIDVTDDLAAGRGAGGGLAIWLREPPASSS